MHLAHITEDTQEVEADDCLGVVCQSVDDPFEKCRGFGERDGQGVGEPEHLEEWIEEVLERVGFGGHKASEDGLYASGFQ